MTQETIIDFGLGYFTGERGMMVGHIVIPIHNVKGELVAYAGRWPGEPPDADTPKYKIPAGFQKVAGGVQSGPCHQGTGAAGDR